MKPRKLQPIKVGFEDEKIAFFPRMASQAEREEVEMALAEIPADSLDRYQKTFEIKRTAISDWSSEMPKRIEKEKGELCLKPLLEGVENAQDAINQFFQDRTVENEEVISKTYNAFLSLMSASVDFL